MAIKRDLITSAIGILVLTLLCGILYPLVMTGISQVAFPGNANGQKLYVDGKLVGSKIIGQQFATPVINPKTGKPKLDSNGNPVTTPDPQVLPKPPVGHGAALQRRRQLVRQLRPQQHAHRAGDHGQRQGLPRAQQAVRPRADDGEGPRRRRRHLSVGHRP